MAHCLIFARYEPATLEELVSALRRACRICYPPAATPVPGGAPEVVLV